MCILAIAASVSYRSSVNRIKNMLMPPKKNSSLWLKSISNYKFYGQNKYWTAKMRLNVHILFWGHDANKHRVFMLFEQRKLRVVFYSLHHVESDGFDCFLNVATFVSFEKLCECVATEVWMKLSKSNRRWSHGWTVNTNLWKPSQN